MLFFGVMASLDESTMKCKKKRQNGVSDLDLDKRSKWSTHEISNDQMLGYSHRRIKLFSVMSSAHKWL